MRIYNPRGIEWNYDSQTRTFSADASDLGWPADRMNSEFQFRNPQTGTTVTMEGDSIQRNAEGEPCVFVYRSTKIETKDPTTCVTDEPAVFYARVFND